MGHRKLFSISIEVLGIQVSFSISLPTFVASKEYKSQVMGFDPDRFR